MLMSAALCLRKITASCSVKCFAFLNICFSKTGIEMPIDEIIVNINLPFLSQNGRITCGKTRNIANPLEFAGIVYFQFSIEAKSNAIRC